MQSKPKPPSMLELCQFISEYKKNQLYASRRNFDQANEEVMFLQSSHVGSHSDYAESSLSHPGMPKQASYSHNATSLVSGGYKERRNGECSVGNRKNNASQSNNARNSIKHNDVPEWYIGNEKSSSSKSTNDQSSLHHDGMPNHVSKSHSGTPPKKGCESRRKNRNWYSRNDLEDITEELSSNLPPAFRGIQDAQMTGYQPLTVQFSCKTVLPPIQKTSRQELLSETGSGVIPKSSRESVKETRWINVPIQDTSGQAGRKARRMPTQQIPKQTMATRKTASVATQQTLPQPARETRCVPIQNLSGQGARKKITWDPIKKSSEQPIRERRLLPIQNSSGQSVRETRSVLILKSSDHPATKQSALAEETRTALVQQTKSKTKLPPIPQNSALHQTESETRDAVIQQAERACHQLTRNEQSPQTIGERKVGRNGGQKVCDEGGESSSRSELVGETRTPPVQPNKSQTKFPPIRKTSGLNQTERETRDAAIQQAARACRQLAINEQNPENILMRTFRRYGRREVREAGDEGRKRREGVYRQTDGAEAERTFARVLHKRF